MHEAARMLLYALVAAASPAAFLATLAVLSSKRGRWNGTVFAVGFVLAQTVTLIVVYAIGAAANDTGRDTVNAYVELAAGVAIIVLSLVRPQISTKPRTPRSSPRTKAMLERLSRVTPSVALGVGALLGVGAKRLAITIIAAGSLALAATSEAAAWGLGALYVVVSTVIVWLPVVYSLISGKGMDEMVATAKARAEKRGHRYAFIAGLVLGALLVADAVRALLG
jgi:threonine/homoserine/homoserine lactone efflux protein